MVTPNRDKKIDVSHLGSSDKTLLIQLLQEENNLLKEKCQRLEKRFKELENRLSKNSTNSSKAPSSDTKKGKKKKDMKTTSSRKSSGKKPGGQIGHEGSHLELSSIPDEIVILAVDSCAHCQKGLKNVACEIEKRQVFEIPEPKMWVTEYQAEKKCCNKCGYITSACFPEEITHKTQYGARARSLMVYLNQYQLIPCKRSSEFFEVIYNHKISVGTVVNAVIRISSRLTQVESQIKELLSGKALVHCDETGANVNSERYWVHTVGDEQLTHYGLHKRRGSEATDAIGILPKVRGVMVHDHWKSYFKYKNSRHGLCNAHHLRELRYIDEVQNIRWGKEISDLLININEHKAICIKQGGVAFTQYFLDKYSDIYDGILLKAGREQARRGTIDSHNLLKRLKGYKDSVLLFMKDFSVPFTNNLSEQDLRMNKVKQKISGLFKSKEGGDNFCRIRSVLSTGRKNKRNIFQILQEASQRIISVENLLTDS